LVPEQFEFRKGITIEKAIFILTNSILTALDQRKQIGSVTVEFVEGVHNDLGHILQTGGKRSAYPRETNMMNLFPTRK
jgi:hypothetical protein